MNFLSYLQCLNIFDQESCSQKLKDDICQLEKVIQNLQIKTDSTADDIDDKKIKIEYIQTSKFTISRNMIRFRLVLKPGQESEVFRENFSKELTRMVE